MVEPNHPPHRPLKVLHSLSFREDNEKPTFVVGFRPKSFSLFMAAASRLELLSSSTPTFLLFPSRDLPRPAASSARPADACTSGCRSKWAVRTRRS
jgi:hypothetical protein